MEVITYHESAAGSFGMRVILYRLLFMMAEFNEKVVKWKSGKKVKGLMMDIGYV